MKLIHPLFTIATLLPLAAAQSFPPGTIHPLVQPCSNSSASTSNSKIVCVNHYASVLPYHFYREASFNGSYEDSLPSTVVGNDSSWGLLKDADFMVFDGERGGDILGDGAEYEFMFAVNDGLSSSPCPSSREELSGMKRRLKKNSGP